MKHASLAAFTVLALALATPVTAQPIEPFDTFIANFEAKAIAAGVTPETYRTVMSGITEDPAIPKLIYGQPEFNQPIWDYIEKRVSANKVAQGKEAMSANADVFASIGKAYGVDPYLLGAIWSVETNYGTILDNDTYIKPIVRSLATLVHERRGRLELDEAELIGALLMIQKGPFTADTLVGSWAGAIGHLQVTPTVVLEYGTDGDGDGVVDLHNSLADALATAAVFIRSLGYAPGVDWGMEVELPEGFDYLLADRTVSKPVSFYADLGVRRANGRDFADLNQQVFLYVPAGKDGPKFLMTPNYTVLKGYNLSDSYAMSVAHMADRLKGSGPYVSEWPRGAAMPDREQRFGIQEALIALGLLEGPADGRIGPKTQAAYAKFQASRGEVADGFITAASYDALRGAL